LSLAEFLEGVSTIIVDEVHQAKAEVLKNLLTRNLRNAPIRWGLTGTIPKEKFEFEAIHASIGPVIGQISAKELQDIRERLKDDFPMPLLRFPIYYPHLSNEHVLVSEFIEGKSLEEGIEDSSLSWQTLLDLFRIHGAFLFGIGTFHGDLHPGNCIVDSDGKFVFIDNGAICHAPSHVNGALFDFFEQLSNRKFSEAYDALLTMSDAQLDERRLAKYYAKMDEIYTGFETKPVGEQSLTRVMMLTVRAAVEKAGADFGEEAFPIIRALMYLDGLVIRSHPDVMLIESMGPYLKEFKTGLGIGGETPA